MNILVTYADKWIEGEGFCTQGNVLSIEETYAERMDEIEPLDDSAFEDIEDDEIDYRIKLELYKSVKDFEEKATPIDSTLYWMKQ